MSRIFDSIDLPLLPALTQTLEVATRADFRVGYFNLRGWRHIAPLVGRWEGGEGRCCRLLVGLGKHLRDGQVVVKLFLRHTLHVKRYLLFRPDPVNPIVGYLGSSNLTMAGLSGQGELNVDVLDHDASRKLARWFEGRWDDRWCIDISDELAQVIEERWARDEPIPPYHVYVKIAYHLAREARAGKRLMGFCRINFFKRLESSGQAFLQSVERHVLRKDNRALLGVLQAGGAWGPAADAKLNALEQLLTTRHPNEKILRGLTRFVAVTGDLRVLLATDILSEGQNLQDCAVVVNHDLPWAIIRLIQRAGRVDRIGQRVEVIQCYSFLTADGVERLIRLRARVRQRLSENAEVVGTDETFFEDVGAGQAGVDLHHEKAGTLDADADGEVDLASYAYPIWKNAVSAAPRLLQTIPALPPVIYTTMAHQPALPDPAGVLVYLRTAEGNDALAWMSHDGRGVSESQFTILKSAACLPDAPALPRAEDHHLLVEKAVARISEEENTAGGQLGRPSGARFRVYERLTRLAESLNGTLFEMPALKKVIDDIYRFPLRPPAVDTLSRQLRTGVADDDLAQLVIALREKDRLRVAEEGQRRQETRIICSLGLVALGREK